MIAWAGLIFAASSRPDLRVSEDDALDLVLRKLAHLVVFAVLAVLVARALRPDTPSAPATIALAWLVTVAYAISDEWHQSFVDGRVGHPSDVAIDAIGAATGLAALAAWRRMTAPRPGAPPT